jgi:hypothetical protein
MSIRNRRFFSSIVSALCLLAATAVQADGIEDYINQQFDKTGYVNSLDTSANTVVIDDRLYFLSSNVPVFDMTAKTSVNINAVTSLDKIGFKTRALKKPTAPYDQQITRIWILPR